MRLYGYILQARPAPGGRGGRRRPFAQVTHHRQSVAS